MLGQALLTDGLASMMDKDDITARGSRLPSFSEEANFGKEVSDVRKPPYPAFSRASKSSASTLQFQTGPAGSNGFVALMHDSLQVECSQQDEFPST